MHQAWCKKMVSVENKPNLKREVFFNTTNQIEKDFASLVDEMLDKVTKEQPTVTTNVERVENRKGAVERKSYDNSFKMTVINACKRKRTPDQDIAMEFGIDKSLISKWKKQEKKICDASVQSHLKILRKNRPSKKHDAVYRKLYKKFETARKKGLRVSFAWLYANGNKFNKELHKNANNLPKSAITAFIRRYNIKLRRVQRKKKLTKWHICKE